MKRIIARLDIKGPNLVKGIHLEGLRVLGSPEKFAKFYYDNGADEIIFQDVVASLYERNSLHKIISNTVKDIFIPITVGGGLRNFEDIQSALRAGADKVTLNTAAVRKPKIINELSQKFGSSTIALALEVIKKSNGKYYVFIDNGREETGLEAVQWVKKAEELGVGEILITSVDRDGTSEGYDLELLKKIRESVNVPLIAHGGASDFENIKDALGYVDAIAIASAFHYGSYKHLNNEESQRKEGNFSFLDSKNNFNKVRTFSIKELKEYLNDNNIPHRPIE